MSKEEILKTAGERIRNRRNELGITQEELAIKIGYKSKQAISHIENGERDINRKLIMKLAEVLRCEPSYIMGWDDSEDTYYEDAETAQIAQELKDNPNMRILFSASKGASAEALKQAADLLMFLKSRES